MQFPEPGDKGPRKPQLLTIPATAQQAQHVTTQLLLKWEGDAIDGNTALHYLAGTGNRDGSTMDGGEKLDRMRQTAMGLLRGRYGVRKIEIMNVCCIEKSSSLYNSKSGELHILGQKHPIGKYSPR